MLKERFFERKQLIDWRREAEEEIKTLRFCPNCGHLVSLKLQEHKYYQNFYSCERCGELILKKGTIRLAGNREGYGSKHLSMFQGKK